MQNSAALSRADDRKRLPDIPTDLRWGTPEKWRNVNQTIARLTEKFRGKFGDAVRSATAVQHNLENLFPILDDLCARTCSRCPDICCLDATIWFDFRDLIFLHLTRRAIPPEQPFYDAHAACRYLTPKGCRLPRLSRPWVCVWYVCPTQNAVLSENDPHRQKMLHLCMSAVKAERKAMESAFISAVA